MHIFKQKCLAPQKLTELLHLWTYVAVSTVIFHNTLAGGLQTKFRNGTFIKMSYYHLFNTLLSISFSALMLLVG